jgi:hypothetical protein
MIPIRHAPYQRPGEKCGVGSRGKVVIVEFSVELVGLKIHQREDRRHGYRKAAEGGVKVVRHRHYAFDETGVHWRRRAANSRAFLIRSAGARVERSTRTELAGDNRLDRGAHVGKMGRGQYTTIRRDGDRLLANVIGDELELVPVSAEEFRFARSDVSLLFDLDESGTPQGLVMRLGGVDYPATRVAEGG